MSLEAVNQFLVKVTENSQIQEELAKAMQSENDRQAVVELGAKYGFQFSGEELMQEIEKRQQAASAGELNDEALESVAGGFCGFCGFCLPTVTPPMPTTITRRPSKQW
jgi:predicted ribosomally synthesized peptide with nif11-like leader